MTLAEIRQLNIQVAETIGLPVREENWYDQVRSEIHPLQTPSNFPYVKHYGAGGLSFWEKPSKDGTEWSPATNWNQAMFAAEKAGLFDYGTDIMIRKHNQNLWEVCEISYTYNEKEPIAKAETGPIAICKAILFFKEYK